MQKTIRYIAFTNAKRMQKAICLYMHKIFVRIYCKVIILLLVYEEGSQDTGGQKEQKDTTRQ